MVLFNEVRALAETSQEAFTHFYDIMSRKDGAAKDVRFKNIIFERWIDENWFFLKESG